MDVGIAQAASLNPEDFERDMRKFFYASAENPFHAGDDMADSSADFSKIVELQEIKRLYDEAQERHRHELEDRERAVEQLREELQAKDMELQKIRDDTADASSEIEKARKEAAFIRSEMEAKVAKLQNRVKELTANTDGEAAPATGKRGFFSR